MSLSVNIIKKLDEYVLNVKFETESGGCTALLGAAGSGKTMVLRCIAGLENPDKGRIVLNGRVLFDSDAHIDLSPAKRHVGYLFQRSALFPNMTVRQNLFAAMQRLPQSQRPSAVDEKLRAFRLEDVEAQYPRQLTAEQRQRVSLARAISARPELLILDAPLDPLDGHRKWQMELELEDALKNYAEECLLATRDRGEAYRLCRGAVVLSDGHGEQKSDMSQLMTDPGTVSAALISGCKNFCRIRRSDEYHVRCPDWGISLLTKQAVLPQATYAGIHDHAIHLAEGGELNRFDAAVVRVVEDAYSVHLMLLPEGGRSMLRMELPKETWEKQNHPEHLLLAVEPEQVMVLSGDLG